MNAARNRERVQASEMKDFLFKVYQRNSEPEYIQSYIKNVSETGIAGISESAIELQEGDLISGVIEGEEFHIKVRYSGKVVWTKQSNKGYEFGVDLNNEILLPDILIARLMAVA